MSLLDVLQECGVDHRQHGEDHHVSPGWVGVQCPDCGPDSGSFHLGFNLETLGCRCWGCGRKKPFVMLMNLTGLSYQTLREMLGDKEWSYKVEKEARGQLVLPAGLGPLQTAHKVYLEERGFDPARIVELWGIGGIALASRLAWRLFLPIEMQRKIVSWTTRKLANEGLRYVSASPAEEVVSSKKTLYGMDKAAHTVLVVEGPIDVWKIGPGCLATFGIDVHDMQVMKLARYPVRYIAFDHEKKAQQAAQKLCDELSIYPGKTHRIEIDAKDPGSATNQELRFLRRLIK